MKKIILASNSPRRKEILQQFNVDFEIKSAKCKENNSRIFNEKNIINNSENKAFAAEKTIKDDDVLIIAADTMVILDSVCLVKPQSFFEALFMLKNLSGKTHTVVTSHSFLDTKTKEIKTELSKSDVTFRKISLFEIIHYLMTKHPFDKAGSYGVQDFLDENNYKNPTQKSFISKIEGSYYNVMGLDIELVLSVLKKF